METEKKRKRNLIRKTGIVLLIGMLYYCFVRVTGIGIPCFFRLITGLKCPGCGISTMFMKLAELDFTSAFKANRFLFVTFPFLLFELIYGYVLAWRGQRQPRWNNYLLIGYIVCLILFGVVRNLPSVGW